MKNDDKNSDFLTIEVNRQEVTRFSASNVTQRRYGDRLVPILSQYDRQKDKLFSIAYFSDVHIDHKIGKENDLEIYMHEISKSIASDLNIIKPSYLLIGGDISHNIQINKLFLSTLKSHSILPTTIAILGNHELWLPVPSQIEDSKSKIDYIYKKYKDIYENNQIHLIQNSLLVFLNGVLIYELFEKDLIEWSESKIKKICVGADLIILGGLGFSGKNDKYNATIGLYKSTVKNMHDDILMSNKFERVYNKVRSILHEYSVVVFTHMPKNDWNNEDYQQGWIYVNGHTHRNEYEENIDYSHYADNQIGYKTRHVGLKHFYLKKHTHSFLALHDGVYDVERFDYLDFYYCLGERISFNRFSGRIHLLKRNGFYLFLYKERDKLYLLNGGIVLNINQSHDIDYFYENMAIYCNIISDLSKSFRLKIDQLSKFVKNIGGTGRVHGSIVDISFTSHLYLNPLDGKVTPYFATSMVDKYVYKNTYSLLQTHEPQLVNQYLQLIRNNSGFSLANLEEESFRFFEKSSKVKDTTIYKFSRFAKNVQYLSEYNILRNWNDDLLARNKTKKIEDSELVDMLNYSSSKAVTPLMSPINSVKKYDKSHEKKQENDAQKHQNICEYKINKTRESITVSGEIYSSYVSLEKEFNVKRQKIRELVDKNHVGSIKKNKYYIHRRTIVPLLLDFKEKEKAIHTIAGIMFVVIIGLLLLFSCT